MRAVFLVPRRDDGGHRDRVWAWCKARWQELMPDVPIYEGHHTDGPFNRSAAINRASRLADEGGRWDVGIVIDSDVFLRIDHVRTAIDSAATDGKVTWAHRRWRGLAESDTERLIKDPDTFGADPDESRDMDLVVAKTTPISWSCCVAVPRDVFDAMGGFDERFKGWGFEDGAWAALVRAKYPWTRIEGDIFHWWHPRSDERIVQGEPALTASPDYIRNALLGRRYMIAAIRDHHVGDQQGEDRLSPEMVKIHVANLTRDDARFLHLARRQNMPEAREWAKWWPTLDELVEGKTGGGPTVTLIVRTGGEPQTWQPRSGYLRRSLASVAERVSGPIVQRVVYSDWGPEHRAELQELAALHGFYVVGPETHVGYIAAVQALWRYISRNVRGDYVFLSEDDFLFDRPVDVAPMIETLENHAELRQVALLRGPVFPREMEGPGILGWPLSSFEPKEAGNGHGRLEHRNFYTMNPHLARRSIAETPWPARESSERLFSDAVFRDKRARVALWGEGEPWITHIGEVRSASVY